MSEVAFVTGEADAGLRERLDEELSSFNAAATGHHDGRLLSIVVRGDRGDLRAGLYGWTWGGGEGHHDLSALAGHGAGAVRAHRAPHRPAR